MSLRRRGKVRRDESIESIKNRLLFSVGINFEKNSLDPIRL